MWIDSPHMWCLPFSVYNRSVYCLLSFVCCLVLSVVCCLLFIIIFCLLSVVLFVAFCLSSFACCIFSAIFFLYLNHYFSPTITERARWALASPDSWQPRKISPGNDMPATSPRSNPAKIGLLCFEEEKICDRISSRDEHQFWNNWIFNYFVPWINIWYWIIIFLILECLYWNICLCSDHFVKYSLIPD